MSTPNEPRVLLTVEQAAEQLSLSRATVYRLIKASEVASVRIGRARRVPTDALADYVHRLSHQQSQAA